MNLGKAIRKVRLQKGLNQGEYASVCGINRTYLSLIESGHRLPSIETLLDMAHKLNVPVALFFVSAIEESDLPECSRTSLQQVRPVIEKLLLTLCDDTLHRAVNLLGKE